MTRLITIFLLLMPLMVKAEWHLISENDNSQFYVESESIRKAPPFIRYWEKRNLIKPAIYSESTRKTYRSSVNKIQADCYNKKAMTLSSTYYTGFDQKGELLGTDDLIKSNLAEWSDLIPGSMGEYSLEYACNKIK